MNRGIPWSYMRKTKHFEVKMRIQSLKTMFGRLKKLPVVILVHEIFEVHGEGLEHLQFALAVDFVFDVIIGGVAVFR